MEEFNVSSKYYKTILILTFGLSEGSLGEPFCEKQVGFDGKTPIATFAQSGGVVVSDQNGGIQGAQKALQNQTHINSWALEMLSWRAFL